MSHTSSKVYLLTGKPEDDKRAIQSGIRELEAITSLKSSVVMVARKGHQDKLQNLLMSHKRGEDTSGINPQRMSDISSQNQQRQGMKQNTSSHVQLLAPDLGFYDKTVLQGYIQQALMKKNETYHKQQPVNPEKTSYKFLQQNFSNSSITDMHQEQHSLSRVNLPKVDLHSQKLMKVTKNGTSGTTSQIYQNKSSMLRTKYSVQPGISSTSANSQHAYNDLTSPNVISPLTLEPAFDLKLLAETSQQQSKRDLLSRHPRSNHHQTTEAVTPTRGAGVGILLLNKGGSQSPNIVTPGEELPPPLIMQQALSTNGNRNANAKKFVSTVKSGQVMGGGYHQARQQDVNSSMVISEFADVALQCKPIRVSNELSQASQSRTKAKENLPRNPPDKFASNNFSKKDDASTGLSNVSSNFKLPQIGSSLTQNPFQNTLGHDSSNIDFQVIQPTIFTLDNDKTILKSHIELKLPDRKSANTTLGKLPDSSSRGGTQTKTIFANGLRPLDLLPCREEEDGSITQREPFGNSSHLGLNTPKSPMVIQNGQKRRLVFNGLSNESKKDAARRVIKKIGSKKKLVQQETASIAMQNEINRLNPRAVNDSHSGFPITINAGGYTGEIFNAFSSLTPDLKRQLDYSALSGGKLQQLKYNIISPPIGVQTVYDQGQFLNKRSAASSATTPLHMNPGAHFLQTGVHSPKHQNQNDKLMHQMKLMNAYRIQSIQVSPNAEVPISSFGTQAVVSQKVQISRTLKAKKLRTIENAEIIKKRYEQIMAGTRVWQGRSRKDGTQAQEASFGASYNQVKGPNDELNRVSGWDTKYGMGGKASGFHYLPQDEEVISHHQEAVEMLEEEVVEGYQWNDMQPAGAKLYEDTSIKVDEDLSRLSIDDFQQNNIQ